MFLLYFLFLGNDGKTLLNIFLLHSLSNYNIIFGINGHFRFIFNFSQ